MDARQVANNAGGYVFAIDDWARLDRFLVLGSDAPTYYQSARALTRENAKAVLDCLAADAARAIARIVEISVSGRAPKQDPAIFALALATLDEKRGRRARSPMRPCRRSAAPRRISSSSWRRRRRSARALAAA